MSQQYNALTGDMNIVGSGGGGGGITLPVSVPNGGTGRTTFTAWAPVFGGATNTSALQSGAVGTSGQLLTSNGAGATATFQTLSTRAVADGGTGRTSDTAYAVICGGTTSTSAQQSIASVGTAGQVLTSNGAGALPSMQNVSAPVWTIDNTVTPTITSTSRVICTFGTGTSVALPASAAAGTEINLVFTATGCVITQSGSQRVQFNSTTSTVGVGGGMISNSAGASLRLVCQTANTKWLVVASEGQWLVA